MKGMNQTELMGLIRHVVTVFGGGLITNGYVSSEDWQMVAGAIAAVAGIAWSIYQKRGVLK